jgi:hypothetical protein
MTDYNRLPGNWRSSMKSFASASEGVRNSILMVHPDWQTVYTHFLGDALPGEWAAAKTNGTAAAVTVATSQLTMTAGTDNDGYAGQSFGLFWKGDNGIYFESEQQFGSAITTAKLEVGFSDTTDPAGVVATKSTPTCNVDDACVIVFDTDDNTEMDIISTLDNGTASADAEDIFTLVAVTNFTTAFTAQNDVVGVKIGSSHANMTHAGAGSMQGGDLVTPWWFNQTRLVTAANWTFKVEYALVTGPSA